jgi:hypothetical protein
MRLVRLPQPFDHQDWFWEVKWMAFEPSRTSNTVAVGCSRATASSSGNGPILLTGWRIRPAANRPSWMAKSCDSIRMAAPNFRRLLYRRTAPFFNAFDLIALNGNDLRRVR